MQRDPKLVQELAREFRRAVPPELLSADAERTANITDAIRSFYFQQRPVDIRNIDSLIDVCYIHFTKRFVVIQLDRI